jgi:hypothetical protein
MTKIIHAVQGHAIVSDPDVFLILVACLEAELERELMLQATHDSQGSPD